MPLDLSGFVTPEQSAEPLFKLGADLNQQQQQDLQNQQQQQAELDRQNARKTATEDYLKSYLDPKQYLTGTIYDPYITTNLAGILQKASSMASKGIDPASITTLISPDVARLSTESENLKSINAQKKQAMANLKDIPGIDPNQFSNEFDNNAYYNQGPNGQRTLRDISSIDPTQNFTDDALRNGNVYSNEGIADFLKKAKPLTTNITVKQRDKSGRLTQGTGEVTAPNFMVPDMNDDGTLKGFVPKFNIATNGEGALIHEFLGDNGKKTNAPVRVVSDDVWNQTPNNVKGYVLQEVRKAIKGNPNIKMSDPQSEILGKAILYDELKNSPANGGSFKRTDVNLQPLPPRVSVSINGQNTPQTVDMYGGKGGVKDLVDSAFSRGYNAVPFNAIPVSAQNIILPEVRNITGQKDLSENNVYLTKDNRGNIVVSQVMDQSDNPQPNAKNDKILLTIDPNSLNVPGNKTLLTEQGNQHKIAAMKNVNVSPGVNTKEANTKGGMSDEAYKEFLRKNGLTK